MSIWTRRHMLWPHGCLGRGRRRRAATALAARISPAWKNVLDAIKVRIGLGAYPRCAALMTSGQPWQAADSMPVRRPLTRQFQRTQMVLVTSGVQSGPLLLSAPSAGRRRCAIRDRMTSDWVRIGKPTTSQAQPVERKEPTFTKSCADGLSTMCVCHSTC